jgi:hypothetical protein
VTDSSERAVYRPDRRTAVVLTGIGTAGAYHAGVLRALREAGVRIDLVGGRGIGAASAIFAAIDGSARLWEPNGLWRREGVLGLYPWRAAYRFLARGVLVAAVVLCVPVALLALGLIVYQAAVLLDGLVPGAAARVAGGYAEWIRWGFAPTGLPTRLPQLVTLILAVVLVATAVGAVRALRSMPARREQRDGFWWSILAAPLSSAATTGYFVTGLWDLLRGGAAVRQPERRDLARRYAELLTENLGQPGFRELILVAHDLDVRRDIVFALLSSAVRREFFVRRSAAGDDPRSSEALDLTGVARDHSLDALAAALALPVASDPEFVGFAPESYWRGETHRLCDRPAALGRLLEEVAAAGVRQVVIVSAAAELVGPHGLSVRRAEPRARLGDWLGATEAADLRDAVDASEGRFDALFVIRPAHNPVGPLDVGGAFDDRSERWQPLAELIDRGYEDAYRQFIDPVVGASGEQLDGERSVRAAT